MKSGVGEQFYDFIDRVKLIIVFTLIQPCIVILIGMVHIDAINFILIVWDVAEYVPVWSQNAFKFAYNVSNIW
jgi:hypothetical protein